MSKPNVIGYSSALAIARNPRIRDLHDLLQKEIPKKIDFAELACGFFQAALSAAGEHQTDGDFSSWSPQRIHESIFFVNLFPVTQEDSKKIWSLMVRVGLLKEGKIRSWARYNRHLADYDKLARQNRKNAQ